jgi:hypothetical protein
VSIDAEANPPVAERAEGVRRAPAQSRKLAQRRQRAMRKPRGNLSERITLTMIVGTLALLLAFVLVIAVLRDRREMVAVVVPSVRIPAGAVIDATNARVVDIPASVTFSNQIIDAGRLDDGLVAGRTLEIGEPITVSAIGEGATRPIGRLMPLPISSWGLTGGELEVGDEIDVIDTRNDTAVFVMTGAVVIDRSSSTGSTGGLAANRDELWVSIEVTSDQALQLAEVINAKSFLIVRSTGANGTAVVPAVEAPVVESPVVEVPADAPEGGS